MRTRMKILAAFLSLLVAPLAAQYPDQPVGTLHVYGGVLLQNDIRVKSLDTAGDPIDLLVLDGSNNLNVGVQSAVPGAGGQTLLWADAEHVATVSKLSPSEPFAISPALDAAASAAFYQLGTNTAMWDEVVSAQLTLGRDISSPVQGFLALFGGTSVGAPASLAGVELDGGPAIETWTGAFRIGTSFYNRTFSAADKDCTAITDGWTGLRTDTLEFQYCVGETLHKLSPGGGAAAGGDNEIQYKLSGAFAASASLKFFPDVSGDSNLELSDTDGAARLRIIGADAFGALLRLERQSDGAGWAIYRPGASTDLRFFALPAGGDRVWLTAAGNLGIGVSPSFKLDVNGVSNFRNHIRAHTDGDINIGEGTTGNRFQWGFAKVWNGERIEIDNAANTAHWAIHQPSGDISALHFKNTSDITMLTLQSGSPNAVVIPAGAGLRFVSSSPSLSPFIQQASSGSDPILSFTTRISPSVDQAYWLGSLDKRWDIYHGRQINLGTASGATSALALLDAASSRGSLTLYSNTGSQITQVQLRASAADNLADSLVIRNASAAERVKAGVSSSGTTGSVAVLNATGNTITMIATGNASTEGFYVGNNRVVGARGAAVANATDAASVILRLNELLARVRAHGLIAP